MGVTRDAGVDTLSDKNAISFFYVRCGKQVNKLTVNERKFSIHIQVQHLMPQSVSYLLS